MAQPVTAHDAPHRQGASPRVRGHTRAGRAHPVEHCLASRGHRGVLRTAAGSHAEKKNSSARVLRRRVARSALQGICGTRRASGTASSTFSRLVQAARAQPGLGCGSLSAHVPAAAKLRQAYKGEPCSNPWVCRLQSQPSPWQGMDKGHAGSR